MSRQAKFIVTKKLEILMSVMYSISYHFKYFRYPSVFQHIQGSLESEINTNVTNVTNYHVKLVN